LRTRERGKRKKGAKAVKESRWQGKGGIRKTRRDKKKIDERADEIKRMIQARR
jgi:hypothetical protein